MDNRCKLQDHGNLKYSHICTYKQCDMVRKCCSLCIQIHNHSMPNQNHIMQNNLFIKKWQEALKQKQKDILNNQEEMKKEQFLWQFLKDLEQLIKQIKELEHDIRQQLDILNYSIDNGVRLEHLSNESINKMVRSKFDFNVESLQDPLNQIQQYVKKVIQNMKEFQELKPQQTLNSRKYEIIKIQNNSYCQSVISSNNEKYLVYNQENIIHVYDIKMNKISKSIIKGNKLTSFQFTLDSQYLFAGDDEGFVYGFFASKDLKQFYKQKINQESILQIKIIQKYLISYSSQGSIIKTDYLKKRQIFQLKEIEDDKQQEFISIDYDIQYDILICTSEGTIKIWDCQNQIIIINYKGKQDLRQVQIVNNKQNILCLDGVGNLLRYKINYQNKQLVVLDQYYDSNLVGFEYFNNDQNLLLIHQQDCRILNNEGDLKKTIYHFLDLNSNFKQNYKGIIQDSNFIVQIILSLKDMVKFIQPRL